MGGTSWSDASYTARGATRASLGVSSFAYTDSIKSGKVAAKVHATLDPKKMSAGPRECLDSKEHSNSNPIFVGLDVTGSMLEVPKKMQTKLKELMAYLLRKGYIEDPAICIAGIGDAEAGDEAPFQLGQFESGIELEDNLTNLFLEGHGGGNNYESYDLALYFLARCVKADAFDKRNKKGYAFIICDESLPERCKKSVIKDVFGITEQQDIPIETLIAEANKKWEIFCIVPNMTSHYKTRYQDNWKKHFGQNVIFLEDPNAIVETIAGAIGMLEENTDMSGITSDIKEISGLSANSISAVSNALSVIKPTGKSMKKLSKKTSLATL